MKMRRAAICALVCGHAAVVGIVHADELTRQLQEEMRRRYQYFGEIDGRPSEELAGALKNYQKRKGLPISGTEDEATTASLGIKVSPARHPSGEARLPDGPVLRSDEASEISDADREFLRGLEETPGQPGPDLDSNPAPASAPTRNPTPTAAPEPLPPPVAAPPPADAEPEALPPKTEPLNQTAAERFIRNYLDVAQADDPSGELRCYAERVDYFDHGKVDRGFIEKDVRRYYKRWSERKFTVVRLQVTQVTATEASVDFRIRFELKGRGESAAGQTDNNFRMRQTKDGFELIQLKEKRVRS